MLYSGQEQSCESGRRGLRKNAMAKIWRIKGGRRLLLAEKSLLMGIVNVTPDSFSDGGSHFFAADAVQAARIMCQESADILDIGGESSRPQAAPAPALEEQRRILPVIEALAAALPDMPLSVDTRRAATAAAALQAGAHIVNDIFGLQQDAAMAPLIAETGAGIIIMHTGRGRQKLPEILADQRLFFTRSLEIAAKAGIDKGQIVLDPGFGFAKTERENIMLLRHAEELRRFGLPLLAGTSRKGFLGALSGQSAPQQRDIATAASSAILRLQGFSLFRVHNIPVNRQALAVADAVAVCGGGRA